MSARPGPTSDPAADLAGLISDLARRVQALEATSARIPGAPVRVVATIAAPGPPPTYTITIVNDATGGVIILGVI